MKPVRFIAHVAMASVWIGFVSLPEGLSIGAREERALTEADDSPAAMMARIEGCNRRTDKGTIRSRSRRSWKSFVCQA